MSRRPGEHPGERGDGGLILRLKDKGQTIILGSNMHLVMGISRLVTSSTTAPKSRGPAEEVRRTRVVEAYLGK
jgi:ABC-type branched-subunit amino acid transport system ATPase component